MAHDLFDIEDDGTDLTTVEFAFSPTVKVSGLIDQSAFTGDTLIRIEKAQAAGEDASPAEAVRVMAAMLSEVLVGWVGEPPTNRGVPIELTPESLCGLKVKRLNLMLETIGKAAEVGPKV